MPGERRVRVAKAGLAAGLAAVGFQIGPAGSWLAPLRPRRLRATGEADSWALTFDDGPDPHGTPAILDALDRLGLPATFFVLGSQVRRDPGLLRETVARGHEIGLHGDGHRYLIARSPRAAHDDLVRGWDSIAEVTGEPPRWWRPPYGVLSGPALVSAARLGLDPVLWSAWGRDWRAEASPMSVLTDVLRAGLPGATVLLHDSDLMGAPGSWRTTLAALPLLAAQAERRDLSARLLSEHTVLSGG